MIAKRLPLFADLFVYVLGIWTLYAHLCVLTARTFSQLVGWSWIPLAISIALMIYLSRREKTQDNTETAADSEPESFRWSSSKSYWLLLTLSFALVLAFIRFRGFWLLALIYFLLFNLRETEEKPISSPPETPPSRADDVSLVLVAILAIFFTLCTHRPDIDDALFLAVPVSAVDNPDLPLLSFDCLHGDPEVPTADVFHKPETYTLLVATMSKLTGLPAATHYYFVFPAVFAALFAASNWLLLNRLAGRWAWLGLIATFVALVAWGDYHQSYGNYTLVRLFQGKAVYISVFVPLIVYYTIRFAREPSVREWILLLLVQIAAVGCSSTAAMASPLCSAVALLAGAWPFRQNLRVLLAGAITWSYSGLVLLWLLLEKQASGLVPKTNTSRIFGMEEVFGDRTPIVFGAFVLLPLLASTARLSSAGWLGRYIPFLLLLVTNEATNALVSELATKNMLWRLFWAVPAPSLLGASFAIAVAAALKWNAQGDRRRAMAYGAAIVAVTCLFLGFARWTIAESNQTQLGAPKREVNANALAAAEAVLASTTSDDLVLSSWQVSVVLTGFHDGPQLILARPAYVGRLVRSLGEEEASKRSKLSNLVSGLLRNPSQAERWALNEVKERNIATIVLHPMAVQRLSTFRQGLKLDDFSRQTAGNFEVWTAPKNE